ncbi:CD44 antigen isoform X10 [Trichechus manatus latirostris]|uniref:CD44 antigen n=1 Tax=Trichechus manatus latirostris TaxID=127582 RepID=A0A2Y9RI16_TRIMA|nr:CD44 antigen isoform X10 [Trichechus manatus latirostris]
MNKLWWRAAWGLCLVQLSLAQIDLNITCRYAGVFHVEKNGRYSISRTEAADLCKAFNSTLPTLAQMEKALSVGFETCRYGFIEGHVVIPRIVPVSICAANNTGVYILTSNTSQYDTYCFNASAPADKEDCTSVTDLPNTFEGPITITIVNRDGTRYSKKGEYRTNPEDINPSNPTDDDVSSGSSSERTTSGGYNIFHTHLPTADPTKDQASPWVTDDTGDTPATITSTLHSNNHAAAQEQNGWLWSWFGNSQPKTQDVTTAATTALTSTTGTTPETITKREEVKDWFSQWFQPSHSKNHLHTTTKMAGTDSNTMSAGWDPNEENEDETGKPPSYSGSGIDDDEDFISRTISTITPAVGNTGLNEDWKYWSPQFPHQELELQTPTEMTDVDRSGTSAHGENWTQEPQPPLIHREHHDDEETQHSTRTNRNDGRGGRRGENLPEDSTTSVEVYTPHFPDTKENRTLTPVTPAQTGSPGVTEVTVVGGSNSDVAGSFPGHQNNKTGKRSHTTHGSESAGHSSGSQEDGANTTANPIRKAQIPEWLIILASLLALALILAVCIAVNSRRRCGQKKKLVINNGNGAVEDRKPSGLNGEASKSQEMVHLVNKEPSETPDQCMTADETRNLQNVDVKIGM